MPPRKSPATGRDGTNGPSPDDIRQALAIEIIDRDLADKLREQRKRHRKHAEGKGVDLGELDYAYKMRDSDASEIEKAFRARWAHISVFFSELADQLDLFVPKATRERKAAFKHTGLMAGLKGEKPEPPLNLVGDELQQWTEGYNEGAAARVSAKQTLADTLAEALEVADAGGVVDGTGKKVSKRAAAKAAEVAAQAAADFAKDNPGLPLDQSGAPPAELGSDTPASATDASMGSQDQTVSGQDGSLSTIGDGFEATAEELAAQKGRAGAEDATDPFVVGGVRYPNKNQANAARRLREINTAAKAKADAEAERPDSAA